MIVQSNMIIYRNNIFYRPKHDLRTRIVTLPKKNIYPKVIKMWQQSHGSKRLNLMRLY